MGINKFRLSISDTPLGNWFRLKSESLRWVWGW